MFLYELAMELDERSADLAERAEAIGLGTLGPTTELTAEQASALRAAYRRPLPGAPPGGVPAAGPPASWGPPTGAPLTTSSPARSGGRPQTAQLAIIGVVVLAALAGFGYMFMNSGPDESRQQAIKADLESWNDAPPATIDPKVAAEAAKDIPGDEPSDEKKLCAAQDVMYDAEIRINHAEGKTNPTDLAIWRKAVDDMARWGPADAKSEVTAYRDAVLAFYDAADRMSLGKARPFFDEVKRAEDRMYPQIVPFCGMPGD